MEQRPTLWIRPGPRGVHGEVVERARGRVDRIGSPHDDVYIGCVFPDDALDRLLRLEDRVRIKLAQAAASIGVESDVVPGGPTAEVVFAGTINEIEALRREEADLFETGGEDPKAHSGEEYRQELRQGLENRGSTIRGLPWAVGSGFRAGLEEGHFFCCKVGDRLYLRFVPSDVDDVEGVITNTLECLRRISCDAQTPRYVPDNLLASVYDAWSKAKKSVFQEWQFLTDPANLQPRIRPLFRDSADHIRRYPPPTITQEEVDQTVEALEAPWGMRIERELRNAVNAASQDPHEKSRVIYEKVNELALEPFVAPDPLPPIYDDEIQLVCWMAISVD